MAPPYPPYPEYPDAAYGLYAGEYPGLTALLCTDGRAGRGGG